MTNSIIMCLQPSTSYVSWDAAPIVLNVPNDPYGGHGPYDLLMHDPWLVLVVPCGRDEHDDPFLKKSI